MRRPRPSSVVGISFESGWITAAVVRLHGGRVQIRERLRVPLSLNPLVDDPELVGREIHNRLTEAGIREKRCVVCVPLKWVFSLRTGLPDISGEDLESFLRVQAERSFPFSPDDLCLSSSCYHSPSGTGQAMLVGIPRSYVTRLQAALRSARLNPLSITLGITSILGKIEEYKDSAIAILLTDSGVELGIVTKGGVVTARPMDDAVMAEQDGHQIDSDLVAREVRITLAQLPEDIRDSIRDLYLIGPAAGVTPLMDSLKPLAERSGLTLLRKIPDLDLYLTRPEEIESVCGLTPVAISAGARCVLGYPPEFEFLPPKISRLKQLTGRVSSRGTRWLGAAAVFIVVTAGGTFFYQDYRLRSLESRWEAIEPKVKELEEIQSDIRKFRPWFDDSVHSLTISRALTEAFPEKATVWAKDVSIKESSQVTCSGFARTNQDWLDMRDHLRASKSIKDLKVQQIRGKSPLEFTFSFVWSPEDSDGNQ